ncbi:MAG TPA: beta-propeller domain-containing protein, partial [Kofleriaceae bacterium]|nr:beta-propeller domain-containing protein [Kofleriaceae bacterium]
TYMHMLDETHLLTIGYDADDHGSFAYFDGVMLQIFDVTDMTAPTLAHKHVIGTRGSSSEALTNHLAFTWYPAHGLLSIPMTVCEGGDDGLYGSTMTFSGLMLFDVSATSGFAEHGRVAHPASPNITCNNWWTDASSVVRRSLFLDQFVYSISDRHLKVRDVGALATPVADLNL